MGTLGPYNNIIIIIEKDLKISKYVEYLASNPGSLSGGGKRAWYTLSAHAPKFPEILGIRIFVRLLVREREP
jgi:hypothetical protein